MIRRAFETLRGRWARRWVRPAFRFTCTLVMQIVPPRKQCVVFAWPDREGNGVEVLRYLADTYPGRIYWLRSEPELDLSWFFEPDQLERIEQLSRTSLHGLLSFLLAETVFFTHGAFDRPGFGRGRTFVNLWHGDGPKTMVADPAARHDMPSSVIVSGTELFGKDKARHFRLPESALLITGNPRIDQFKRLATDAQLDALELLPGRPIILWAPTYRTQTQDDALAMADGEPLSRANAMTETAGVAAAARAAGVQLVVKPHPLDADRYEALGVRTLTDADLDAAHLGLYSFLARCAALISDYSSIWTDFLVLDRPVALYCPDLDQYVSTRGLNVDLRRVAPGPFLSDTNSFARFFEAVVEGPDAGGAARRASIQAIGSCNMFGATARLIAAIDAIRLVDGVTPLVGHVGL